MNESQKKKISVAERIMKVISGKPKTAEEIKKELKDKFGYSIKPDDIRINLLYLLRREKIQRKKGSNKMYQYYI